MKGHHFVEPAPPPMPPWFYELSPEQQATVGGHPGMGAVESDGIHTCLKEPARVAQAGTPEEAEQWFFDTHGCESVRGRPVVCVCVTSAVLD